MMYLVSQPEFQESHVCEDLVTLTDVTATMLSIGGCKIPAYMDAARARNCDRSQKGRGYRAVTQRLDVV